MSGQVRRTDHRSVSEDMFGKAASRESEIGKEGKVRESVLWVQRQKRD